MGLCLVIAAVQLFAIELKTFTSSVYGYQLRFPKSWNVDVPASGVPVFFNYARSEAGPQGLFPEKGANIFLVPFAAVREVTRAADLKEWIQLNDAHRHSKISIRALPSSPTAKHLARDVFEVKCDFERDPQDETLQREVDYYFHLDGQSFRLMLLYWKGDPQAAYFESVLDSIFRSIRGL